MYADERRTGIGCFAALGFALVMCIGECGPTVRYPSQTVTGRQAFMHDASTFSVVAQDGRITTFRGQQIRLLYDVPTIRQVRMTCWGYVDTGWPGCDSLIVHVHPKGPEGAGWDYGKFGHGQTVKVP